MKNVVRRSIVPLCLCALALANTGCSIKMMAINALGNALAGGSSGFAKDDDPELVRDAVPFALKTIESLIEQSPRHKGLLLAACSGFTQYSYAFIQQEADFIEAQDHDRATAMRASAWAMNAICRWPPLNSPIRWRASASIPTCSSAAYPCSSSSRVTRKPSVSIRPRRTTSRTVSDDRTAPPCGR